MFGFIALIVMIILSIIAIVTGIPLLQIIFGIMSFVIGAIIVTEIAYPYFNILVILVGFVTLFEAYRKVKA